METWVGVAHGLERGDADAAATADVEGAKGPGASARERQHGCVREAAHAVEAQLAEAGTGPRRGHDRPVSHRNASAEVDGVEAGAAREERLEPAVGQPVQPADVDFHEVSARAPQHVHGNVGDRQAPAHAQDFEAGAARGDDREPLVRQRRARCEVQLPEAVAVPPDRHRARVPGARLSQLEHLEAPSAGAREGGDGGVRDLRAAADIDAHERREGAGGGRDHRIGRHLLDDTPRETQLSHALEELLAPPLAHARGGDDIAAAAPPRDDLAAAPPGVREDPEE
mmetsp:Transcript_4410/g.14257  ORF Transcript_4410/g.14257 Transcript_4410/m.14257 type:complete len:283 (+) Transcript_4410:354-1202(+)